jgi:hypothetical protein
MFSLAVEGSLKGEGSGSGWMLVEHTIVAWRRMERMNGSVTCRERRGGGSGAL